MSIDVIRKHMNASPFVPFAIVTGDREIVVEHPDFVSTLEGSFVVIEFDKSGDYHVINVVQIKSMRVMQGQSGRLQ